MVETVLFNYCMNYVSRFFVNIFMYFLNVIKFSILVLKRNLAIAM